MAVILGDISTRIPAPHCDVDEVGKRAAPAIFIVDAAGAIGHAFGDLCAVRDREGVLCEAIATAACRLVTDRDADGATSAAIVGDMTLRLLARTDDERELSCLVVERLRTRDLLGPALERYQISPREAQVLKALLEGKSTTAIAETLSIAETTAADHVKNIARKTGARGRGQIVARILGFD